jgi:hypothetical protein
MAARGKFAFIAAKLRKQQLYFLIPNKRCEALRLPKPPYPGVGGADSHAEPSRRLIADHPSRTTAVTTRSRQSFE